MLIALLLPICVCSLNSLKLEADKPLPLVITTWNTPGFRNATQNAFLALKSGQPRMAALVEGLSTCERLQCDTTVGFGGSPDEDGVTTLDALLIDGPGMHIGAVAQLHNITDAARVAWAVMNFTKHTMLVGEAATKFAVSMGFQQTDLTSNVSINFMEEWRNNKCQPNFWKNVLPDPNKDCGPYKRISSEKRSYLETNRIIDQYNHDTIGMVIVDVNGDISAGTSTNGARYKIPGRVGDSSIIGAGAYVIQGVGAAAATGDGDILMKYLPSYQTVEFMRLGTSPGKAAKKALQRVTFFEKNFSGAVIAANKKGEHNAACVGLGRFTYTFMDGTSKTVQKRTVICTKAIDLLN